MTQSDPLDTDLSSSGREVVTRAFGAENRARLLARYFAKTGTVTPENAWQQVYRLLLWIDRTTSLAHCYESDKAQPGRVWYARSLAFHDWISNSLGVAPADLGENIDWLFRAVVTDLAARAFSDRTATYVEQRAPYDGRGFPEPGEDPELVGIIKESLGPWMTEDPSKDVFRKLTRRIHAYVTQENKRKNLVGEGFEDVIAAVLKRLPFASRIDIRNRSLLHDLPGFHTPPPSDVVALAFENGFSQFPVVDDGQFRGLVTENEIIRWLGRRVKANAFEVVDLR